MTLLLFLIGSIGLLMAGEGVVRFHDRGMRRVRRAR